MPGRTNLVDPFHWGVVRRALHEREQQRENQGKLTKFWKHAGSIYEVRAGVADYADRLRETARYCDAARIGGIALRPSSQNPSTNPSR